MDRIDWAITTSGHPIPYAAQEALRVHQFHGSDLPRFQEVRRPSARGCVRGSNPLLEEKGQESQDPVVGP